MVDNSGPYAYDPEAVTVPRNDFHEARLIWLVSVYDNFLEVSISIGGSKPMSSSRKTPDEL